MGEALSFIKRHVKYYDEVASTRPDLKLTASDSAIRENSLTDLVLFYGEGFERHPEVYSVTTALKYFKDVENGTFLGRMILQLAKFLRYRQKESELLAW